MANQEIKHQKPSKLEQFSLGFEFNETWQDARRKLKK